MLDFSSSDWAAWGDARIAYSSAIESLANPKLAALDVFYCDELPRRLQQRQRGGEIAYNEDTEGGVAAGVGTESGDVENEDAEAGDSKAGSSRRGNKLENAKGGSKGETTKSRNTRRGNKKGEDTGLEGTEGQRHGGKGGVCVSEGTGRAYVSKEELVSVMEWKLTRGKWRPRLLDFIKQLDPNSVQTASSRAFAALAQYHTFANPGGSDSGSVAQSEAGVEASLKTAVTELSVLKGVGPATASAVLAAFAPEIAPFMSDEAMVAALGDSKDYSLRRYLVFAKAMREKAHELNHLAEAGSSTASRGSAEQGHVKDTGTSREKTTDDSTVEATDAVKVEERYFSRFTASNVEKALWSATVLGPSTEKKEIATGSGKKRSAGSELASRARTKR